MSLDGKLATRSGESKWITGSEARRYVMALRREHDGILVGVNTVIADDPSLTVRHDNGDCDPNFRLKRFVMDSQGRIPLSSKIISHNSDQLTTVLGGRDFHPDCEQALQSNQLSVRKFPADDGRVDVVKLCQWLAKDGGVRRLLVEGGGRIAASFVEARVVSAIRLFYAPKILGGRLAPKALAGTGATGFDSLVPITRWSMSSIGQDLVAQGDLTPAYPVVSES